MKVLVGVGFVFRIVLLCLLGGFALGLYVGIRATAGEADPASGAALPGHAAVASFPVPGPREEVSQWRRTPSFWS